MRRVLDRLADVDPLGAAFPLGLFGFLGVVVYGIGKQYGITPFIVLGVTAITLSVAGCLFCIFICTLAIHKNRRNRP